MEGLGRNGWKEEEGVRGVRCERVGGEECVSARGSVKEIEKGGQGGMKGGWMNGRRKGERHEAREGGREGVSE
jgi:hypothetical protein